MMSRETEARIRKMTPSERLSMTLQLIRESTPCLFEGPADIVRRRFEALRQQNDARNENMRRAMARSRSMP